MFNRLYAYEFPVMDFEVKWCDDMGVYRLYPTHNMFNHWKQQYYDKKPEVGPLLSDEVLYKLFHYALLKFMEQIGYYLSIKTDVKFLSV